MQFLDPNISLPLDAPSWTPDGAIPPHVRQAARYFHTDDWWPGDVLLLRSVEPGTFQKQIQKFQQIGGYSEHDARWTHAAIYMGDAQSVCEATVPGWRFWDGGVIVSSLYEYVGKHHVRVLRSRDIKDREIGWRVVVHALSQLGKPYDLQRIANFVHSTVRHEGFWSFGIRGRISQRACICSTLYADAYRYVTGVRLGERANDICVPAFLSQCQALVDVPSQWARLVAGHTQSRDQVTPIQ